MLRKNKSLKKAVFAICIILVIMLVGIYFAKPNKTLKQSKVTNSAIDTAKQDIIENIETSEIEEKEVDSQEVTTNEKEENKTESKVESTKVSKKNKSDDKTTSNDSSSKSNATNKSSKNNSVKESTTSSSVSNSDNNTKKAEETTKTEETKKTETTTKSCTPKEFYASWFIPEFTTQQDCINAGEPYVYDYAYNCLAFQDDCGTTYYMLQLHDENGNYVDYHTLK